MKDTISVLEQDQLRYANQKMPVFQKYYRLSQMSKSKLFKKIYHILFAFSRRVYAVEFSDTTQIGPGLYIGHPYGITINPKTVMGSNINIHKGVTIGQENRGKRKGVPTIGNDVWIGINSTIVGNITIGDDVLIAPNSYVNRDIPSHSIVIGNPCIIKPCEHATKESISIIAFQSAQFKYK